MPRKDAKKYSDQVKDTVDSPTPTASKHGASKPGKASKEPRAGPGICRLCLSSLKYWLLVALIPPFLNYAALQQEAAVLMDYGLPYDIGFGQKLFLNCTGTGKPTVILDAPTGMSSEVWSLVQPELAKTTRVCTYDRAGLGMSDRPPYKNATDADSNRWTEFTVERMADDLHRLVTLSSQQEKPFVLVGSELGAMVARFYTQLYPSDVSDLVLIDPLVEDLFSHDNSVWSQYWFEQLTPSFQSMQLCAAAGFTRILLLLGILEPPVITPHVDMKQKYLLCNPRHLSSVVDEHHFINVSFSQMRTVGLLKQFPADVTVTVITGNYYDEQLPSALNKAWAKSQQHLISRLHPGSSHLVVNGADHRMLYRKPEAVIEPIRRLVRQRRSRLPITDSKAS